MQNTLEIIDTEIARLQKERKKVENASLFIKELPTNCCKSIYRFLTQRWKTAIKNVALSNVL